MTSFKKAKIIAALIILSSAAPSAFAGDEINAYQYTGACGSQGSWTQQALQRTAQLRSFITNLRNDGNCTAYKDKMEKSILAISNNLDEVDKQSIEVQGLTHLPQEIGALRTFISGEPEFKGQVLGQIFSKMVHSASSEVKTLQSSISTDTATREQREQLTGEELSASLSSLAKRASVASSVGLRVFNETIDDLPKIAECLVNPNGAGQLLAASVKVLGAFASSGQASSSQMAEAISKITNYSREQVFAASLAKLKQNDFMASLACLLEMTSENYCSTRDAAIIFNEMSNANVITHTETGELHLNPVTDLNHDLQDESSPLAGYYVLTQNIPMITEWLQMIQLGAEPRLKTDAMQKNNPLDQMNSFQKKLNDLRASVNSSVEGMRAFSTFEEKRLAVEKLVKDLSGALGAGSAESDYDGGQHQNFFTLALAPVDMPFYLIGIPTPPAVKPKNGFAQNPSQWLDNNYKDMTEFNDPETLAKTISSNLNQLIAKANLSAVTFYNKWLIIDKVFIVNRALIGQNYNVKEGLLNTRRYLMYLEKKVKHLNADPSFLPPLVDTRLRIEAVLNKFAELETLGEKLKRGEISDSDSQEQLQKLSENLIKEVFDQFYVMLAKSGWLALRMSDFVMADFQIMQRSGIGLDKYVSEIYAASGRALAEQIIRTSEGNPANVKTDLSMALHAAKGNLESLQLVLGDSYLNQIAVLEQTIKGYRSTDGYMMYKTKHPEQSYFVPSFDPIPGRPDFLNNPIVMGISGIWKSYMAGFGDFGRVYDQINSSFSMPSQNLMADDEFGSARILKAQYCVQTLAFGDLSPFWNLCNTTVLESPFINSQMTYETSVGFKKRLNVTYKDKAWEGYHEEGGVQMNLSKRICAFRDFNRRNLVLYLTRGTRMGPHQALNIPPSIARPAPANANLSTPVNSDLHAN